MNFEAAFNALIGNEGNYSNDAKDPGNWTSGHCGEGQLKGTKYGISAASYPLLDIKQLTLADAMAIYQRDFWTPLNVDGNQIPEQVRFDLFDTAVNSGHDTAVKLLQQAVNVKADGNIGPITRSAIAGMPPELLDKRFSAARLLYLTRLDKFPIYGKGWVNRIANNLLKD